MAKVRLQQHFQSAPLRHLCMCLGWKLSQGGSLRLNRPRIASKWVSGHPAEQRLQRDHADSGWRLLNILQHLTRLFGRERTAFAAKRAALEGQVRILTRANTELTEKIANLLKENKELAPLPKQMGKLNKQLQDQGLLSQKWLDAKNKKDTLELELDSLKSMVEKTRAMVEDDKEQAKKAAEAQFAKERHLKTSEPAESARGGATERRPE